MHGACRKCASFPKGGCNCKDITIWCVHGDCCEGGYERGELCLYFYPLTSECKPRPLANSGGTHICGNKMQDSAQDYGVG
jgi:hypothetical protein